MIPKIIHYCWFGKNPKPKLALKCIKSWKKYCPEYEFIEWNEDNFDISSAPLYVRQAYEAKKWAFVTDYVRLKIVYDNGGLYFDTDVELIRNFDALLSSHAFFGFEDGKYINTGLGFGAEKNSPIVKDLMDDYSDISFIQEDGSYDEIVCPVRNTRIFVSHGLLQNNSRQMLDENILILPKEYFCPINYEDGILHKSEKTMAIHWFSGSWQDNCSKKWIHHKRILSRFIGSHLAEIILGVSSSIKAEGLINYVLRHVTKSNI